MDLMDNLEQTLTSASLLSRLEKTAAVNEEKENIDPMLAGAVIGGAAGAAVGAPFGMSIEKDLADGGNRFNEAHAKIHGEPFSDVKVKPNYVKGALKGGSVMGLGGALLGGGVGLAAGYNQLRKNQMEQMEQTAAESLVERLEKTANETFSNEEIDEEIARLEAMKQPVPEDLGLSASDIAGGFGAQATGGLGAILGGAATASTSAVQDNLQHAVEKAPALRLVGAEPTHTLGSRAKALGKGMGGLGLGIGLGTALGAVPGNMIGSAVGALKDRHDYVQHERELAQNVAQNAGIDEEIEELEAKRQGAGSVSHAPAGVDKSAESMLDRLEKTAASFGGAVTKAKEITGNITGSGAKKANKELSDFWSNPDNHKLTVGDFQKNVENLTTKADKATDATNKSRQQLKTLGLASGGGAVAGAGINEAKNHAKMASEEDFMNEIYKEAATSIINEVIPEVKIHTDPMDRISFNR